MELKSRTKKVFIVLGCAGVLALMQTLGDFKPPLLVLMSAFVLYFIEITICGFVFAFLIEPLLLRIKIPSLITYLVIPSVLMYLLCLFLLMNRGLESETWGSTVIVQSGRLTSEGRSFLMSLALWPALYAAIFGVLYWAIRSIALGLKQQA